MASSLAKSLPSMPVNSREARLDGIDRRCAKASIEINSTSEVVALAAECIGAIGMSDKEAAFTMALDPAQWSRIKAGAARLPVDALWRMPDRFWAEFRSRIDDAKNLTADRAKELRAARIGELVRLLVESA